jgi:hypothetical protein
MLSSRLQMVLTGRPVFHAASASTICIEISSRPPKAPPTAGVAHDDLLVGQPQRVGDLLALFVHPLAGADHFDAAIGQYVGQPGLGLEIGVLLRVGAIGGFDDHIGCGKARGNVALLHAIFEQQVGLQVAFAVGKAGIHGVQHGAPGCMASHRIGDNGQRFIVKLDQFGGGFGLGLVSATTSATLSASQRTTFRLRRAAGPAEHRLVGHDQPIFVDRHIRGGQHGKHAGRGQRGARRRR